MPAGHVRAEVARRAAGKEDSVDDRVEWLWRVGDACKRRNCLGGDVGLLRGDPTVLDREVGRVAGGVDALDSTNLAAVVYRNEAVSSYREARERRAVELGQRDDQIGMQDL